MKYTDAINVVDDAWCSFFETLRVNGINAREVEKLMDNKDCFNSVFDCIMQCVEIEEEDD